MDNIDINYDPLGKNRYQMDADLGLFNQLLQMVDGDWSDSLQGICDHILTRMDALGVVLSVFDKSYDEFIYIVYSIKKEADEILTHNKIKITTKTTLNILKTIYKKNENILEQGILSGDVLHELAKTNFDYDDDRTSIILKDLNLKSVIALPVISDKKDFSCFFHICTDREVNDVEKELFDEYINQLNIATEIIFLVRELYIKATHDGLTKLFNHKQGEILLGNEFERVKRNKQPLSLVMLDIDFFKKVNDKFGHQAGDEVLKYIGNLLSESLRRCDIISRYGGEEFMLVLPDTELKSTFEVIDRLKDTIQNHKFVFSNSEYSVTSSFGLVQFDEKEHKNPGALINDADKKLYEAKNKGRNRIEF